jgi:hypothetical protein
MIVMATNSLAPDLTRMKPQDLSIALALVMLVLMALAI